MRWLHSGNREGEKKDDDDDDSLAWLIVCYLGWMRWGDEGDDDDETLCYAIMMVMMMKRSAHTSK